MINEIGRIVILVQDYDEAFLFYHKNFGFKILFDHTTPGGQRFLHIGTDLGKSVGIWFLKAEGKEQQDKVGNQTGKGVPVMVIYTSSLDNVYNTIKNVGGKINVEPVEAKNYNYFHCLDLYGNEIVVVELNR